MTERLAVVGGDAAGMSAASAAVRRRPDLDVVVFERGPYTSYSACGIPYLLGGEVEDPGRLIARSADEFRAAGIDVRRRCEVTHIDLAERALTYFDHEQRQEKCAPFDQLIYAAGAVATAPPVPGAELVEPARTLDAAERFLERLKRGDARHAVVVGASYLGLEMAEALVRRGLNVTLVDRAGQVMPSLDPDIAAHVQSAAENIGVRVLVSTEISEIRDDGHGAPRSVMTSAGEIPADHVVLSTGVRPLTDLAEAAGLRIGATGALEVDDRQRCPGFDGVFAAGDCVESWHRVLKRPVNIQLGTHANKQGRIAGTNAAGADVRFPGVVGTAVSKLCGFEVARTGISEQQAAAADLNVIATTVKARTRAGYYPGSGPIWVKLIADPTSGQLLGGQIVGVEGAAKRIDVLATAIWTEMTVHEIELLDLAYAPPFSGVYDPILIAARQTAQAQSH